MITANIRSRQRPLPGKKPFLTWDRLGIMLGCAFLFLILVLQDTHSNGDLLQYYNRYTSLQYTGISSFLNGFWDMKDPVYHFLSLLFGKLGFDFYAWKSLIAFVFVLGVYKQIQYYSTNPSISFLAILTLGLYGFVFSGLRQTLAFGILLFSYPHLKNKHFFRFVLLVVLAAMFHSTALIFLVVYPIYQLKLRVRNVLLLIVAGTVASFFANPIAKLYLQLTGTDEAYSTYLEGLENYILEDGKIHTIFKQNFARTGRLSSTEPNLQNIPVRDDDGKKIRKAFFPTNDIFLSADYSQIELRILAHISGAKELQEAFLNDQDIHTKVAADIYGVSESEVSKKMRSTAKAVIFGIVYGISGFGLGENLEISAKEANSFIDKYYELYPGVKKYMDKIVEEAYSEGCVRTLFKRRRTIPELNSGEYMVRQAGERIALNTPIQGTSADIIKKAMVEIYQKFQTENIKSKMVLQVHDELIFDVIEKEKEKVEKIVIETMTNTIKLDVPLKVSADYGKNWYDVK